MIQSTAFGKPVFTCVCVYFQFKKEKTSPEFLRPLRLHSENKIRVLYYFFMRQNTTTLAFMSSHQPARNIPLSFFLWIYGEQTPKFTLCVAIRRHDSICFIAVFNVERVMRIRFNSLCCYWMCNYLLVFREMSRKRTKKEHYGFACVFCFLLCGSFITRRNGTFVWFHAESLLWSDKQWYHWPAIN